MLESFVVSNKSVNFTTAAEEVAVKHHQSCSSLNCSVSLMKKIFLDSLVCWTIPYGITKAEAIIDNIFETNAIHLIMNINYILPKYISSDASNHSANFIYINSIL